MCGNEAPNAGETWPRSVWKTPPHSDAGRRGLGTLLGSKDETNGVGGEAVCDACCNEA